MFELATVFLVVVGFCMIAMLVQMARTGKPVLVA